MERGRRERRERGGKCLTVEKLLVRVPVRLERQSLSKARIKTIEGHQEMFGREESQRGSVRKGNTKCEAKANQKVNIVYVVITRHAQQQQQQPRPPLAALSFDLPDVFVDAAAEAESEAIKMR